MVYIKKLVMHGFKSFVRRTEVPFTPGINVILGPNGSGKSNVPDAMCFVLGRLSIKSIRAAKAGNLIFIGNKLAAPAKEASVEIVFDNSNRTFSVDSAEISIKRIVNRKGQSIYKINNETKTRQDILSLLAQAGIDPNGFNIILQGEIQNLVRMQSEERRKIIEEVSGISVYESRKEKSMKELEKTEEKLKEISAILRERTAYLNNLEKERQQALRFKKLESDVRRFKASIIYHSITEKKKELSTINGVINARQKEKDALKKEILKIESSIAEYESIANSINKTIRDSTGLEQEKLNQEIANLRAELAGMGVNLENFENKLLTLNKQKKEYQESINETEKIINELQKESPSTAKKEKEITKKKQELDALENERKKFYEMHSELRAMKERIDDKKVILQNYRVESDFLLKQINSLTLELFDKKPDEKRLKNLKSSLLEKKNLLAQLNRQEIELEKICYANESEIENNKKISERVSKIDICPMCKSRITPEHLDEINREISSKISTLGDGIKKSDNELKNIHERKKILEDEIEEIVSEIMKREADSVKHIGIDEKKEQIKVLYKKIKGSEEEIEVLGRKKKNLEKRFDENSNIEQKYESMKMAVQEVSLRSEENINTEILFKKRELERSRISIKQFAREEEIIREEIENLKKETNEKKNLLEKKKKQDEELTFKYNKLMDERDSYYVKIREIEKDISEKKNAVYNIEGKINEANIEKARASASVENLEIEILEFSEVEIIRAGRQFLSERLVKTQEILSRIGTNVNLRSLEVYDSVKSEYESIKEKSETISKEKESVLKIVHEIDIKKKKTFLKTLDELNEIFSRNFSQLSTKGTVSLELENRKSPFDKGVGITVKIGHGKYFDVKSLSGGEQTIVALSLIFAIQELNPYYFYILDEIDAALDKKNSERLAGLLKKYMRKGQYIVVTHNDEIITNATNIYGVSMHDGISKIISLRV